MFGYVENSHAGIIDTFLPFFTFQFATVEVSITFIKDEFGPKVLRYLKTEELLTLAVCIVCFILGIPHVTRVRGNSALSSRGVTLKILSAVFCCCCFLSINLSHLVAQGGIYIFQLMDHYTAVESLMFLASCEVIAVCWIFGKSSFV